MNVTFTDHSAEAKAEFEAACLRALEKCGLVAEGYAIKLCPERTGRLKNSITHQVDKGGDAVYIGTNVEYGAYVQVELGTGKYYPGGRQDPWLYEDENGVTHITHGQRAKPYLKPAINDHRDKYIDIINKELKGSGGTVE